MFSTKHKYLVLFYSGAAQLCLEKASTWCGASTSFLVSLSALPIIFDSELSPELEQGAANWWMSLMLRAGLGPVSDVILDFVIWKSWSGNHMRASFLMGYPASPSSSWTRQKHLYYCWASLCAHPYGEDQTPCVLAVVLVVTCWPVTLSDESFWHRGFTRN